MTAWTWFCFALFVVILVAVVWVGRDSDDDGEVM